MTEILVVSGARDGSRSDDALKWLRSQDPPEWVVTGGANGVDRMVRFHGEAEGWRVIELLAAGPIRNGWMLTLALQLTFTKDDYDCGTQPSKILCVAFPGPDSKGTQRFIEETKRRQLKLEVL